MIERVARHLHQKNKYVVNEIGWDELYHLISCAKAFHCENPLDKDIRQKLIETGHVDVMISVGNNFFYTKSLPCSLWFFDKGKKEELKDKVLFIDARSYYTVVDRTLNEWSEWQLKNMNAIVWLYRGETDNYKALLQEYHDVLGDEDFDVLLKALEEKTKALRDEAKAAVESAVKKDKKKMVNAIFTL